MLEVVTRVRNSSQRKTAISSRYNLRFSGRCSQRASIISGVIVRFRPIRVEGACTLLNCRKFAQIFIIVAWLHSASSAILDVPSDWLSIMSRMRCSLAGGSLGAILWGRLWHSREIVWWRCLLLGVGDMAENYHCMAFTSRIHKTGSHLRHVKYNVYSWKSRIYHYSKYELACFRLGFANQVARVWS